MKAIITGGNRGIGLEISKKLLSKGFEVHVLSRSGVATAVSGLTSWTADVAEYDQLAQIVEKIGTPDVLINNAGIMNAKTARDYDSEAILHMLHVNLISTVRLSVHVAERMAAKGGGRIVSMGSIAGEIGHPDIWYGVSKAAS